MPLIPLLEVEGNKGGTLFRQRGPIGVNTGCTCEATSISIDTGDVEHCPAAGVKV